MKIKEPPLLGVNKTLDIWHEVVDRMIRRGEKNVEEVQEKLASIMHDNVNFHPPTYWKVRRGKVLALMVKFWVSCT